MRPITHTLLAGAVALAVLGPVPWGVEAVAQPDPIATRKEGLRRMQGHLQALTAAARGGGDVRGEVARADDMIAWFRTFPELFPAGSDRGDTRALPTVWSDRAGFERRGADMVAASERLRAVIATGDAAALGPALQATGGTCGACHQVHRGR